MSIVTSSAVIKPRWLLIDDQRVIPGVEKTARTYFEGLKAITMEGPWECIIFDHDLSCEDKTGYDLMCLLEERPELIPNNILIVTQNASARPKMEQLKHKLLRMKHEVRKASVL